jgi:hypothetical protein
LTDSIWNKIIYRSKKRGQLFNISKKYAEKLLLIQNFKCNLSGLDLYFATDYKSHSSGGTNASLDRIDSSQGYIEGNVQWVDKDVNKMKMAYDEKYFKELCKKISEYEKINLLSVKDTDEIILPSFNKKRTIEEIIEIKKALLENKPIKLISEMFKIKINNIYSIKSGRSWKHVSVN